MAGYARLRADGGSAVEGFEFEDVGGVGDAQQDFAHVDRFAVVRGHEGEQVFGFVEGLAGGAPTPSLPQRGRE
ncbi:hypothetical protein D9M68_722760 [compost metagenome]